MAAPLRSYRTLEARGAAPNSRKYSPTRSSFVQTTWSVQTPASRAWLAISRPSGLSVSRDTQLAECPSRATATAVFHSAPPAWRSRLRACSSRRKFGGASRTIASPNVTTSLMLRSRSVLFHDVGVLSGEVADAVEVARGHGLRLDQLAAHPQAAGARLQE